MTVVSCLSDPTVTFSQQSEVWLDSLKTRKRKSVSPATLHAFGSYVRRLTPIVGEMKLAEINNGVLRELVQKLDNELSPKTIAELVAVVKSVVGSLVDENTGEPILKREWSARFIDCPTIANQKQYCASRADIERCIKEAGSDQERTLYCVLAGSGLRIAEALAVHVGGRDDQTSWNRAEATIHVRSSVYNGHEISRVKTPSALRTVDLDPRLNDLIAAYVDCKKIKQGDFLFASRGGRATHVNTARYWLAARGIPGFHSFRRFRITRLRELGIPEDIIRYWAGHAGSGITDRYSKLGQCADLRRQWAIRAELGFDLPEIGPPPQPPKSSEPASHQVSETLEPQAPAYVAVDSDLPEMFFEVRE